MQLIRENIFDKFSRQTCVVCSDPVHFSLETCHFYCMNNQILVMENTANLSLHRNRESTRF